MQIRFGTTGGNPDFSFRSKALIAAIRQNPQSKERITVFKGKLGYNTIVSSSDKTTSYIGLPGSKIELPDAKVEMPGERLSGKKTCPLPQPISSPQQITNQVILLCGGLSSRFAPISGEEATNLPKPAVPLTQDESIARNIAHHVKQHGFTRIFVHTYYLQEAMKKALEGIEGVELVYLDGSEAPGSAGVLYRALTQGKVDETKPMLVIAGDAVTNGDLSALAEAHQKQGSSVTIGVQKVDDEDVDKFGIIRTTDPSGAGSGEILQFLEKPTLEQAGSNRLGSTGIYLLSPDTYGFIQEMGENILEQPRKPGQASPLFDFGLHFLPAWLKLGKEKRGANKPGISMLAEILKGYWNDAGNAKDYLQTLKDIAQGVLGREMAEKALPVRNGAIFWPGSEKSARQDKAHLEGNIVAVTRFPKAEPAE